jgi:hypothetical protein
VGQSKNASLQMDKITTFEMFLQNDCGGHPLRTILDNLEDDQIEECAQQYAASQTSELVDALREMRDTYLVNVDVSGMPKASLNEIMEVNQKAKHILEKYGK